MTAGSWPPIPAAVPVLAAMVPANHVVPRSCHTISEQLCSRQKRRQTGCNNEACLKKQETHTREEVAAWGCCTGHTCPIKPEKLILPVAPIT